MGQFISVECLEGQTASNKTVLFETLKSKAPTYTFLNTNPGKGSKFLFYRANNERDYEEISCLDILQSNIAFKFYLKVLAEIIAPADEGTHRLFLNRTPLCQLVYEFWWRRLFPLIQQENNKRGNVWVGNDSDGWLIVIKICEKSTVVQESLEHFKYLVNKYLKDLETLANETLKSITIYLTFPDPHNREAHKAGEERRRHRAGFAAFLKEPVEGEKTEDCSNLYSTGESILWNAVWEIAERRRIRRKDWSYFNVTRLHTNPQGLVDDTIDLLGDADEERADPQPELSQNAEQGAVEFDTWAKNRACLKDKLS